MLNERVKLKVMIKVKEVSIDRFNKSRRESDWEVERFDRESVEELLGDFIEELDVEVLVITDSLIKISSEELEIYFIEVK